MVNSVEIIKKDNDLIFVITKERMYIFDAKISFEFIKPHLSQFIDNIIFDLKKLQNFDSSFVSLLIHTANTMNIFHKKVILKNVCIPLKRTIELYGISSFFEIS